jgi:predicted YcjX-like family ATPase
MHAFDKETTASIDACLDCHKACLGMAMTHCLEMGGEHVAPPHFRMMIDCAAICATTADFMLHKSEFHREMCRLCATVCRKCAQDCASMDGMEDCVAACRACAEACAKTAS